MSEEYKQVEDTFHNDHEYNDGNESGESSQEIHNEPLAHESEFLSEKNDEANESKGEEEPSSDESKQNETPPKKPRLLMIALGGCNGCHVTILDLHEELLDVLSNFDVVRASVIADMNRTEIPKCDVAIIEGAVCNKENEEVLKEIRSKSEMLIPLGSCACFGGIPGLRNYFEIDSVIKEAYIDAPSNVNNEKKIPNDYSQIPEMLKYVKPVSKVVNVDFMIPGCPPVPRVIKSALGDILDGKDPKLPTKNLCDECTRTHADIKPGDRSFFTFKINTVIESDLDPDKCFIEQGVLCMGPATRSGCEGRCTLAGMPCRGCMGPNPEAIEQGSEMSNAMAPMLPIGALIQKEDLAGTFYRYALPSSILPRVIKDHRDIRNFKKRNGNNE
ncbi:MAG: F420-nonreducing hydrogenase [Nanoarchaeota archaeon]